MPMKCSVCSHKQVKRFNTELLNGKALRDIALRGGMSHQSVYRHLENCLKVEVQAVIQENKVARAIDVHEEFREQLDFAKKLRQAAEFYLRDTSDPLKLSIIPRADEIDITYLDHTDMTGGEYPQPKQKTAKLSVLLATIEEVRNIEADKINIKHVDLS